MADPKAEAAVEAVQDVFEAMTGTYAPDNVIRSTAFHQGVLDTTHRTVYSLSPGDINEYRFTLGTTNNIRGDLTLGIALCRRLKTIDEEKRATEQHELVKAAVDAIRADRQLSGASVDLVVDDIEVSAEETFIEGWVLAFMRVTISYLHSETAA